MLLLKGAASVTSGCLWPLGKAGPVSSFSGEAGNPDQHLEMSARVPTLGRLCSEPVLVLSILAYFLGGCPESAALSHWEALLEKGGERVRGRRSQALGTISGSTHVPETP